MREKLELENLSLDWEGDDIALIRLDMPGKSANIINDGLQNDLERVLDELDAAGGVQGAMLYSAKEKIFVAGADLTAIVKTLDWSDAEIVQFCERGQRLFNRLQTSAYLTVAAIHGACVGGGLELALGCSLQIASDDRRTLLGLPETKLGLIPGWAGTVRIPRLVGLETGIDLIAQSTLFGPEKGLELGVVNRVVPRGQLMTTAFEMIRSTTWQEQARLRTARQHAPCNEGLDERMALSERWASCQAVPGGIHPFAQKVLAQHVIESAELTFSDACASEARAMARVYGSPPSRGLLNVFFLNEHQRKSTGAALKTSGAADTIEQVSIVGAGVMGQAIARCVAEAKSKVKIFDADRSKAEQFVGTENRPGLSAVTQLSELFPCDLLIDCVAENRSIKQKLFADVRKFANSDTLLATNTSAISLTELFSETPDQHRVLGIHYCHPELMQLVEVVRHPETSDEVVGRVVAWLQRQRKTALIVKNAPGFVVNRLLTALIDAAIGLFEEGNSLQKIDQALEEFGFLGGPFKMMDTIGLDTVVLAGRAIAAQGVIQVSPSPILPMLVKKKRLGRKTLAGFYRYATPQANSEVDEALLKLIQPYQRGANKVNVESLLHRILANMLIAAGETLERGVAASPKDVDLAMIQGLSFPGHFGGLLFWADQTGPDALADALIWNIKRCPNLCLPQTIVDWQRNRIPFYQTIDES
ncbi:MAG: enoyl-CoA hydratase/isomerase family protein [Pirellulaceae bacterium]|nr:enoyl-CoA hydratase/isomerase family protein [Pirellulaceae bacterium]